MISALQSASIELESFIRADCALRRITYRTVERAPASLRELRLRMNPSPWMVVPVSGANSDGTVWSNRSGNYRFRAWHDAEHLAIGAEFDVRGELDVAAASIARVRDSVSAGAVRLLSIEVVGQVMYRARQGAFPTDQVAFTEYAWKHGINRAVERGGF
jgi:hypothetical protein